MDKTGPQGKGPQTGRGLGNCNNTSKESLMPHDEERGKIRNGERDEGRGLNQNVKTD
jgi:hypothetical protein